MDNVGNGMQKINISGKYVLFKINRNEYGIDIDKIVSIEKVASITRVPSVPNYIKGIINLRGDIIPVIDLRVPFEIEESEDTDDTRIIVMKTEYGDVGFKVDSVSEVVTLTENEIEDVGNINEDLKMEYILGIGKIGESVITLFDIEKLLSQEERLLK